jgi:hypothetical protein
MIGLVIVTVVGALGSFVLFWARRASIMPDLAPYFWSTIPACVAADGWLAAMSARSHHGVLGDERGGA